jgi:hypothetical protein
MSLEEWNARKQEQKDKSIAKLKAIVPKSKKFGALPADFKSRPYRWDTRTGKWVPDGEAPAVLASGLIMTGKPAAAKAPKAKAPADELGVRVASIPLGLQFKQFALANDCWNVKYEQLSPGLQRMNAVNRLRAKVKRGHKVNWPA